MLKKQLEERDKQLAAEQEDSAAAKSRLRDLTKVRPETHSPVKKKKIKIKSLTCAYASNIISTLLL